MMRDANSRLSEKPPNRPTLQHHAGLGVNYRSRAAISWIATAKMRQAELRRLYQGCSELCVGSI